MPLDIDRLNRLMEGRRKTDIAVAAGMRLSNFSAILAGRRVDLSVRTLERLAAALGVRAGTLLK